MGFLAELKRRNVLRMAGLYVVGAWLVVQVVSTMLPIFGAPDWLSRSIVVLLAIGFVPALLFSWVFQLTPEGLRLDHRVEASASISNDTGRRMDRAIIVALVLALGYFAVDKFVLAPRREAQSRQQADAAGARPGFPAHSVAVLPFADMSPAKDQEYMSDGLAEEVLNLLAKVPQMQVTSRSSAFSFKGKNVEIAEIARRLHVGHVLEGSVRKAGNRLRVTAKLIDARTDTEVWSEEYDRPLDDIFAVQDEIAAAVVGQLKITLLGEAPKSKVVDRKAYALFLQARPLSRLHTADGYEKSNALYLQGLAIDPDYAPAWDGLAYNYRRQANNGMRPSAEGYRLAREALDKALAIDPDYAPSIAALGRIALDHDGDLTSAARNLERALALEPTNSDIIYTAARVAESLGRLDLSSRLDQYALSHDPLNPTVQNVVGMDYRYAGRFDASVGAFRKVLEISPDNISAHYRMGEALLLKKDYAGALAAFQQEPHEAWRMVGLPMAYHALGDRAKSEAAFDKLIAKYGASWTCSIAYALAYMGDADAAFEWLDKAVVAHDVNLAVISIDNLIAGLHQDPRWLPFLRKLGRAPEQLAAIKFDVKLPGPAATPN
jgi:TolB-like protein/lipoprotein NlpI